jgi:DNA-binding CsgD family transcriptional regulator
VTINWKKSLRLYQEERLTVRKRGGHKRALLGSVPSVRLAVPGEKADVRLVLPEHAVTTDTDAGLTPRELEVLELLAEGASNKTIARGLGISVHTAKFHVRSLIDKLDATGRTDAVAHAARLRVIHL